MKEKMIKFRPILSAAFFSVLLAFSGCSDINNASSVLGIDASADDIKILSDNDGKSDKDTRKENGNSTSGNSGGTTTPASVKDFGDNFIRGFDASAVDYFENEYASAYANTEYPVKTKCTDSSGEKDIFNLLADHGFNTIRLRVWVDPSETSGITDNYWPTSTSGENWHIGDCTKERAARLAKRAKTVGMKVLLDLHLSDYWTDPSVQLIPKAWRNITTSDAMAEKLSSYITETLQYMKDSGASPDYVQVGNEIDRGILVDSAVDGTTSPYKTPTAADSSISGRLSTDNFKKYIKAGCKAVRDFDSNIKIVVHITAKNSANFTEVNSSGADYDIVGLSYYPWQNHGTISELKTKIQGFSKDVWIVETSSPAKVYGDSFSTHMTRAATHLGSGYSDVTITDSKLVPSEDSQKAVLRHIMQEVYDAGGKGICVWGGERRDYQYGLFDWNGNAYKAIDAFNYKPADGYTEDETTDETMTVKFVFSGFTAETVTVKYGSSDTSMTTTADVSIASDKASATVTLYKSKFAAANSNNERWGNLKIEVKDSYGAVSFSTSENSEFGATNGPSAKNYWFKFSKDSTMTVNCAKSTKVDYTQKRIGVKGAWSGSDWTVAGATTPSNISGDVYTYTISGLDVSSNDFQFGLDVDGTWVGKGNVTISGDTLEEESSNLQVKTSGIYTFTVTVTSTDSGANYALSAVRTGDSASSSSSSSGGDTGSTYDNMNVTISFAESIGATAVKITYYNGNDITTESVEGNVSNNSASLSLTNKYANEWSYENIKIEITGNNTDGITLSGDNEFGGDANKCWFKFAANGTLTITCSQS